mgnify:CR=1 FL=1
MTNRNILFPNFLIIFITILVFLASCTSQKSITKGCNSEDFPLDKIYNSTIFIEGSVHNKETKNNFLFYTGSGGIVWQGEDSTIILTAAHVCNIEKTINTIKSKVENPSAIKHVMKISDRQNRVYPAISYVAALDFDACVIQISKIGNAKALPISKEDPKLGEIIYNVASPIGIYSDAGSPLFKGYYSGDFKFINVSDHKLSLFSLPAAPGSSGSLLLNKNMEIVGVVSSVYRRFHHLTVSPTIGQLRNLMSGDAETVTKHFINFNPPIVVEEKVFLWGKELPEWDIEIESDKKQWKIKK